MSSSTALTGRTGKFVVETTLVARTTQWQVTPTLATKSEWGDSDGSGFTNRAAGRKDCTFSVEGKFDTSSEQYDLFQPEDILICVLWLNNTTLYWDFPRALCDNFQLTVNVDSEEVIGYTCSWGSDGAFYYPGEAGATSRTLPS